MHRFPFFVNILPEGKNRDWVCFQNKIEIDDDFTLETGLLPKEKS